MTIIRESMIAKSFKLSMRERKAITVCLEQLNQVRIELETRAQRDGADDRIAAQIENCHDNIQGVLNTLKARK